MKNATIAVVLFALAFLPNAVQAAPSPALEALETLRRGFTDINDFTAEITQEKRLALMKQRMVSRGAVRFKKPGIFYMELYPPHASRLRLKNNIMTIRYPKEGLTDRITIPPEEGLEKWFAYLATPVTALPGGVEVRAERQGDLWDLRILPGSAGGVKELRLIFDGEGKIKSLTIAERNSDLTVIKFHNLRRNTGLKEQDFQVE
jgi:outer membrane lipoprotein carrier protein